MGIKATVTLTRPDASIPWYEEVGSPTLTLEQRTAYLALIEEGKASTQVTHPDPLTKVIVSYYYDVPAVAAISNMDPADVETDAVIDINLKNYALANNITIQRVCEPITE